MSRRRPAEQVSRGREAAVVDRREKSEPAQAGGIANFGLTLLWRRPSPTDLLTEHPNRPHGFSGTMKWS